MTVKKYEFKRYNINDKSLICPQCFEMLTQTDIENFSTCPFCEYEFELNPEIEDFILQPLVDYWVKKEVQHPALDDNIGRIIISD